MKKGLILLFVFIGTQGFSQNEFAATAFYNDIKKMLADADSGFTAYKGVKKKTAFEELSVEYNVKLLLPLTDSGKIVIPVNGNPYVIYFFEPDKVRLKVNQRALNLMDAVMTAIDKPLYARIETTIVDDHAVTNSLYFMNPDESRWELAAFRTSIYFLSGKYFLSFAINGKKS